MPDTINLHSSCNRQVTTISNTFIDRYMPEANGEYVKIYLYLVRALSSTNRSFSISALADLLDYTERNVRKALEYWESKHLLRLEFDSQRRLVGLCLMDPDQESSMVTVNLQTTASVSSNDYKSQTDTTEFSAPAKQLEDAVTVTSDEDSFHNQVSLAESIAASADEKPAFSPEERTMMASEDDSMEILYVTEQFIGKPLSQSEMDFVLFWRWKLNLSVDLIEFLVEECINAGHSSISYMNKVALCWKEQGITTADEARLSSNVHSKAYYTIVKSFGIQGRKLTPNEENFLQKWTKEYAFTNEIIAAACQRTIAHTGRASFEYADSILKSWYERDVRSMQDVNRLDQQHQETKKTKESATNKSSASNNGTLHNYDDAAMKELERKLLQ